MDKTETNIFYMKMSELKVLLEREGMDKEEYEQWKKKLAPFMPKKSFFKMNSIEVFKPNPDLCEDIIDEHEKKCVFAILSDLSYKETMRSTGKFYAETCTLIDAREKDFKFELKLAEMITGDNKSFPYRSSFYITQFFTELRFNDKHDGSTRRFWVEKILKEKNAYQLHKIITNGLLKKQYFIEQDKDYDIATLEFKNLVFNAIKSDELIDLSELFEINSKNDMLFNKYEKIEDDTVTALINRSKDFFKKGDTQEALEKIWDAFERIKTLFGNDKKESTKKLIKNLSSSLSPEIWNDEFLNLTKIGNYYQIRHYETNKLPLRNEKEKIYLYFRMLSLIDFCLEMMDSKK